MNVLILVAAFRARVSTALSIKGLEASLIFYREVSEMEANGGDVTQQSSGTDSANVSLDHSYSVAPARGKFMKDDKDCCRFESLNCGKKMCQPKKIF